MTPTEWLAARSLTRTEWVEVLAGLRVEPALPQAPPMPDAGYQAFVGSYGLDALAEAGQFYSAAGHILHGESVGRLLDFGCGWGRIYRLFLRDTTQLVGVDIDADVINVCRIAMPYGNFEVCAPDPPLQFPNESFDTVVAYSVFSHLAEHTFVAWMREFRRLLAPGGHVFFTTLREGHLNVWDELTRNGNDYYKAALTSAEFSRSEWERRAASGDGVLFVPTGGGDIRPASFYGEAIVSRCYLERTLPELGLALVEFADDHRLPQAFVAARRAADGPCSGRAT
jgi:SAM-dependent methyltransferase